jgi:hypothetical protein
VNKSVPTCDLPVLLAMTQILGVFVTCEHANAIHSHSHPHPHMYRSMHTHLRLAGALVHDQVEALEGPIWRQQVLHLQGGGGNL